MNSINQSESFHKYIASIGAFLVAAPILLYKFVVYDANVALLSVSEYESLSSKSRELFDAKINITKELHKVGLPICILLVIIGLILFIFGCIKWSKGQDVKDTGAELDNALKRNQLTKQSDADKLSRLLERLLNPVIDQPDDPPHFSHTTNNTRAFRNGRNPMKVSESSRTVSLAHLRAYYMLLGLDPMSSNKQGACDMDKETLLYNDLTSAPSKIAHRITQIESQLFLYLSSILDDTYTLETNVKRQNNDYDCVALSKDHTIYYEYKLFTNEPSKKIIELLLSKKDCVMSYPGNNSFKVLMITTNVDKISRFVATSEEMNTLGKESIEIIDVNFLLSYKPN